MRTPAVIPRSPFVLRTAQPPYSHVENSTRAELDRLGLTALRAMVDVEPYGSSDLGGDPSDDEPPSMTTASPSEDNDPEDPENPSGKKKKKRRKTKPHERRRSQEAKAIATSKIVVNLPEFMGMDLREFAENFGRFLRMTGRFRASGQDKVPGEAGQADRDEVCHLQRRVDRLREAVPFLRDRPLHPGEDPGSGSVAQQPQAGQDFQAAGRPGALGRATDARFLWQR